MTMLFKGQVYGYTVRVMLDNAVNKSFMSIKYARQLRLTWSTKEAETHLNENQAGLALTVCPVIVCTLGCITNSSVRVLGLLTA